MAQQISGLECAAPIGVRPSASEASTRLAVIEDIGVGGLMSAA